MRCKFNRLIDGFKWSHANRTSWSMNQLDFLRKQFIQPVAHDGMSLAAADLHQHPRLSRASRNLRHQGPRNPTLPVLVQVLHRLGVYLFDSGYSGESSSVRAPICSSNSKVRCASCASTRLIAKPTCTITYSPARASGTKSSRTCRTMPPNWTLPTVPMFDTFTSRILPGTA